MNWQWFHRLGSPRWFYEKTTGWLPWIGIFTFSLLIVGVVWGLAFAPEDYRQGNSYRIIYIHVPVAALALIGFVSMAVAAAVGLIWRMKMAFIVMMSISRIGAVLTLLALITGSIWGKPTWGTWWEWDARITSMLILLFLYMGVIALQQAYRSRDVADKACAVLSLVGVINVFIVKYSVEWWNTLHQPATIKIVGESTIDPSMKYPLFLMITAVYLFFVFVTILYARVEILRREERTQWVSDLLTQNNVLTQNKGAK